MSKRIFLLTLTLFLNLICTSASAASFDCKLAHGKVETMICEDSGTSKLDEQLDAAYARLQKGSSDGKAEKAMQLAWLRNRNLCSDLVCLRHSYESRIAELQARSASDSPIVGFWKKEHTCDQATGVYQELCKQGGRNIFWLAIAFNGHHICAIHMATAHLGNRVDEVEGVEPSMTGKVEGKDARVQFRSNWGGTGTALLHVEGNMLHWTVSAKDNGTSWIPDEEVLTQVPATPGDRMPECER